MQDSQPTAKPSRTVAGVDDWQVLEAKGTPFYGQERIFATIERRVAPGDGMFDGNSSYYLSVGASALHSIQLALAAADRKPGQIKAVLDYACGYGRVLRWLRAAFPSALIVGVDADGKAVAAVQRLFDVSSLILDLSLKEDIGGDFDLIWVGSLATHLPEDSLVALLNRLNSLLSANGILVATMHGPYVADRISRAEKTYGLDSPGVTNLLSGYQDTGYGFSAYPKQQSYGVSICTASKLMALLESANLHPLLYQERGWVRHQDCVAAVRKG